MRDQGLRAQAAQLSNLVIARRSAPSNEGHVSERKMGGCGGDSWAQRASVDVHSCNAPEHLADAN